MLQATSLFSSSRLSSIDICYFFSQFYVVFDLQSEDCDYICRFNARYKVDRIGTNIITTSDQYGIYMVFEDVVENTVSEYQIGPKTLATRVGGIIGVGKNLLWILIFRNSFSGRKEIITDSSYFHISKHILFFFN